MSKRIKQFIVVAIGIIIVAFIGVRVYPAFTTGDGTLNQKLHWVVYGFDRVMYHGQQFGSPREVTRSSLESKYGKLTPTGDTARGLQVLASPKSKQNDMLLILQKDGKNCITYGKFGGP